MLSLWRLQQQQLRSDDFKRSEIQISGVDEKHLICKVCPMLEEWLTHSTVLTAEFLETLEFNLMTLEDMTRIIL